MIGLYFIFLICLWMILVTWVSYMITRKIASRRWRLLIWLATVCIVSPLVLLDEIVAKYQFEQLCQENSAVYFAPDAKGKTVYLARTPIKVVEGTCVNIVLRSKRFVDASTGETVVSYKIVRALGGRFMRNFFWGEPILYNSTCGPVDPPVGIEGFKLLGINYIEPPKNNEIMVRGNDDKS